jgi:hypothetical protein
MTNKTPRPKRTARNIDANRPNPVKESQPPTQPPPSPPLNQPSSPQSKVQAAISPGVASNAVRIVQKAVSVLEEEIAIGISSTQRVEQKLVDVDKLRSSQEIVQRFRRDAHDVVDILIDLVNVGTTSLEQMTQRVIRVVETGEEKRPSSRAGEASIPTLAVSTPLKAGGVATIPMTLENESGRPTDVIDLFSSDLISSEGQRIQAKQISFSPEKLVIEPQKHALVTVQVQVPSDTPPGTYSGLLQASKLEQLRAVLSIRIE